MGVGGYGDRHGVGGGDGDLSLYCVSGWRVDADRSAGDGVEQVPELEHDVSRSTR